MLDFYIPTADTAQFLARCSNYTVYDSIQQQLMSDTCNNDDVISFEGVKIKTRRCKEYEPLKFVMEPETVRY